MDKKKKILLLAAGILAALLLTYGLFWYLVPYRSYQNYEATMPAEIETEIRYPTIFGMKGRIRMFVNAYSALELAPGVFGGIERYAVFAGMTEEYRVAVDRELIPLEVINEECEILLDESRDHMLDYLRWAEENWGLE